jgi:hypothetical protein
MIKLFFSLGYQSFPPRNEGDSGASTSFFAVSQIIKIFNQLLSAPSGQEELALAM